MRKNNIFIKFYYKLKIKNKLLIFKKKNKLNINFKKKLNNFFVIKLKDKKYLNNNNYILFFIRLNNFSINII